MNHTEWAVLRNWHIPDFVWYPLPVHPPECLWYQEWWLGSGMLLQTRCDYYNAEAYPGGAMDGVLLNNRNKDMWEEEGDNG